MLVLYCVSWPCDVSIVVCFEVSLFETIALLPMYIYISCRTLCVVEVIQDLTAGVIMTIDKYRDQNF